MTLKPLFAAAVLASAPLGSNAEPLSDSGYVTGCTDAGCFIESRGFSLSVTDATTPSDLMTLLRSLPNVSAIAFDGEMTNMGDSSADLALTKVTKVADDLNEGNLQYMQGDWAPVGEETPFVIRISGLTWQEVVQDEPGDSFAIVASDACADGVVPGGMAINLYRLGDDPAADGCWQLEGITDTSMFLRDFQGDWGQIEYTRLTPFPLTF